MHRVPEVPEVDADSGNNAGTGAATTGGDGSLCNIFRPSLGGGGGASRFGGGATIGNGPISTAINGTIDRIKERLGVGDKDEGDAGGNAAGGRADAEGTGGNHSVTSNHYAWSAR